MSTALVTGGSRGIGRAVCVKLAERGFNIAFSYNSNEEQAKETIALCEEKGVKAVAYKYDVSSSQDCAKLISDTLEAFNEIDVLVNNAGITRDSLIMRISDEDISKVIDVNLKGTFYMMREVSRVMLKQRKGSIINMSSVVGVAGNAGQVNYAASKAGVIGMTKSLAKELAKRKIRVNAIAPGMIATDMTAKLSDAAKKSIIDSIPFGEMGQPEDIANADAFFASEDSRYITGQVLLVDGGMV